MQRLEMPEAWHQPLGAEGRNHGQLKAHRALLAHHRQCVAFHRVQLRGDAAGVGLAGGGQLHAASRTAEQRQAEEFLQPADLSADRALGQRQLVGRAGEALVTGGGLEGDQRGGAGNLATHYAKTSWDKRSEEHTSELQSLMRISYAVFCLKKKKERK